MKKTAHQIWKEAKELKLTGEAFKKHLRENGLLIHKKTMNNMIDVTLHFPKGKWLHNEVMNKLRFEKKIKLPIIPQKGMSLVLDDFLDSLNLSINEKIIFLNATRNEELENEIDYQKYLEENSNWEWLNFEITNIFIHKDHLELWLEYL